MCPSLSFLALYISVSLLSAVRFLCLIIHYPPFVSLSHPQFPVSIHPQFIYLYSILPSTLLCYSILTLRLIPDRSDYPNPYHTPHLYKYPTFDPFVNVCNVPDHSAVSSRQGSTQSDGRIKMSNALPDSQANVPIFGWSLLITPDRTHTVTYRDRMAHLRLTLCNPNSLCFIAS